MATVRVSINIQTRSNTTTYERVFSTKERAAEYLHMMARRLKPSKKP